VEDSVTQVELLQGVFTAPQKDGIIARPAGRDRGASAPRRRSRSPASQPLVDSTREPGSHVLDPDGLGDHIDRLYRAAYAMCRSRHDAEDLVQETFANVLRRPRLVRTDDEIGYLLRTLRNTHTNRFRASSRQPATRELFEDDVPPAHENDVSAREIMRAIASAPAVFRDAVIAVDVVGLSYREASRSLCIREATLTTRLHRGRQRVARKLLEEAAVNT